MLFAGIVIVSFKILAMGPHIHKKDGAIQIGSSVLFCCHGLFDGVHAAYRGTVAVVAPVFVP
jgi:hypothetical protein